MGYKDKDGNVFTSMRAAAKVFCTGRACSDCPLNGFQNHGCWEWAEAYPEKAAGLMGLEVLEEPGPEKDVKVPGKPRLADVLGVKVRQKWRVVCPEENIDSVEVWLNEKGHLIGETLVAGSVILCAAINHPESIIRAPRLTEPEIAIMRAVGAKWVSRDEGFDDVFLWSDRPRRSDDNKGYYLSSKLGDRITSIRAQLFPSVKPGECIGLDKTE